MKSSLQPFIISLIAILFIGTISSCRRQIAGCTNPAALNYNSRADFDNGTCIARIYGCMDNTSSSYNPQANTDNGTCQYTGSAVFFYNQSQNTGTVTIAGLTSSITSFYPSGSPDCGASGCANFTLPVGTYTYHVENSASYWDGTLTITANGCVRIVLV